MQHIIKSVEHESISVYSNNIAITYTISWLRFHHKASSDTKTLKDFGLIANCLWSLFNRFSYISQCIGWVISCAVCTKKYVASDVKDCKINRVRYLFLFLGIGYIFFYRVIKHCLHLSIQLTYQDCFKCFGAGLRGYPVLFVCSNLSSDLLAFLKNNPVHGMHQVMPKFFD